MTLQRFALTRVSATTCSLSHIYVTESSQGFRDRYDDAYNKRYFDVLSDLVYFMQPVSSVCLCVLLNFMLTRSM
jgi:hypothetical protein